MNRLVQTISDVCRTKLLTEKWLVAPSLRVGHQWLESVVRNGQSTINLHVKTIKSLVIDLASPEMAASGRALASRRASALIVDRALRKLRGRLKYFTNLDPGLGIAETFLTTIDSVRLAGLDVTALAIGPFEIDSKGEDLALVAREYLNLLAEERLIDQAEVLRLATSQLASQPECLGNDTIVLLPADVQFEALERRLFDALPPDRRVALLVDEPDGTATPKDGVTSNLERMRWLLSPTAAPAPLSDETVRIVRSVGEVNEVRQTLRHCIAQGIPWDDVELLHTDTETYVTLAYETFLALDRAETAPAEELPMTFAEGIPCHYARPGRALIAWLRWIQAGFPQAALERMLKEGLLELGSTGEEISGFGRLADLLRPLGIGMGRQRYLPKLDERISSLRKELASRESADEETSERSAQIERDLRDLGVLQKLISRLLEHSPDPEAPPGEIITKAIRFIEEVARSINKLDRFASEKLIEELHDMQHWLARDEGQSGIDLWEWLQELPRQTRVLGSGPRPGCLHVDSIHSGGHSGRAHTFIVGLDDSRFPGAGLQDPLLLDSERRKLSSELPTARGRLQESLKEFARLLARLRGQVTLSFACQSLVDDREMFASPAVLAAFRLLTSRPGGDQQQLLDWLQPPCSFAPRKPDACLDSAEWWLWRLCGGETVTNAEELVDRHFPHLAHGRRAAAARLTPEFGPYDGHVPQAGVDLDPTLPDGLVLSANRLETAGRCPRAFFFQQGLKIKPPIDSTVDPSCWLDPLTLGLLLHRLFEEFIREIIGQDRTPQYDRDQARIQELLDVQIRSYRELYPPPNENAFQRQVLQLRDTALTFLREEEQFCAETDSRPVFLETSLGMHPGDHGSPLDDLQPLPLHLVEGGSIRVRGRVDRVDQVGKKALATYSIWDYKTGSDYRFEDADPFMQGRHVQPFLYTSIVLHRLRSVVSPEAKVVQFGFFFPGTKAMGRRIQWTADQLTGGQEVVGNLVKTIRCGAFLATNDSEQDCSFCDYRPICGDVAAVSATSQGKLACAGNEVLNPFRSLRPSNA